MDIARFEAGTVGMPGMSLIGTALIRRALETAGVEFTDGGGPGVRLKGKQ